MDVKAFRRLVAEVKAENPVLFGLDSDPPVSEDQVRETEALLGVELPTEYRAFVKEFGAGYFGYTNVFSATPKGHWSIVERNQAGLDELVRFVAVSDNGVGDYYGFRVRNGVCESVVCFWDHESCEVEATSFTDLFDYLAEIGLKRSATEP